MAKKRKVGRPTKYNDDIPEKMLDFFDIPLTYKTTEQKMSASGVVMDLEVVKASPMPTFEGFSLEIGVCMDTLTEWKANHKPFSLAYRVCKGIQKRFLMSHGLSGAYNSNFAKFVAINCTDMVDRSEVKSENDHTVKEYGLAFDLSKTPEEVAKINEAKKKKD